MPSSRVALVPDPRPPAPWPLARVERPPPSACVLCAPPDGSSDEAARILHRGRRCFVALSSWPYNSGQLSIAPFAHVASLQALDEPALLELMTLSRRALGLLRRTYRPDGFNLGMNDGRVPGGGEDPHLSLELIPRWAADTGFIATVGLARVIPQSLADSYVELRAAFSSDSDA